MNFVSFQGPPNLVGLSFTEMFLKLYPYLRGQFKEIDNRISVDPAAKNMHSVAVRRFFGLVDQPAQLTQEILRHQGDEDYPLILLALFRALGETLRTKSKSLMRIGLRENGVFCSLRPQNPIYEGLSDPAREFVGKSLLDFSELRHFHFSVKGEVVFKQGTPITNHLMGQRREIVMAVTPFFDQLSHQCSSLRGQWEEGSSVPFLFERLDNAEACWSHCEALLERCLSQNISVLILPELTVDPTLLDHVRQWLKTKNKVQAIKGRGLLMVVAGSYHQARHGKCFNVATVLDFRGEIWWEQMKNQRYALTPQDVEGKAELIQRLKISVDGGHECIETGSEFICIDTPVGRLMVCICIDFFHQDHQEILVDSGANVFMVPAMSPLVHRFTDPAGRLAKDCLATTLVANSGAVARKEPGNTGQIRSDAACFIRVPSKKDWMKTAGPCDRMLELKVKIINE